MICQKCDKLNEDGRVFCYQCGEFLIEKYDNDDFKLSKKAKKIEQTELKERRGVIHPNKMRKIRPVRTIALLGFLAVIALSSIVGIRFLSAKTLSKTPVYYLKNDMLKSANYNDNTPYLISETPAIDPLNYSETGLKSGAFKLTDDYKYCYYFQGGNASSGYTLLRCDSSNTNISEDDNTLKKIDTNVLSFSLGKDGKKVVYKKAGTAGGAGKLYYFDGNKAYGIADNVNDYCFDYEFNFLYYTKITSGEISLYETKLSNPDKSFKVIDGVSEIDISGKSVVYVYGTENVQHISIKEFGQQSRELGMGSKIILQKVFDNFIYYCVSEDSGLRYEDFLKDIYKYSDEKMTEPVASNYPAVEDYLDALDRYHEKLTRDSIRTYMSEYPISLPKYKFYRNINGTSYLIDEGISNILSFSDSGENVLYIKPAHLGASFDISDYVYGDDLKNDIELSYIKCGVLYLSSNDSSLSVTDINKSSAIEGAAVTENAVYYISNQSELKFYSMATSEAAMLSTDITRITETNDSDTFYAFYEYLTSDISENSSELYTIYRLKNGQIQKIADDVIGYEVIDSGNIVFVKGESSQDNGTLYLNSGNNTNAIDTFVYAKRIVSKGSDSILYFKNYKKESGFSPKADLYWYKNSEPSLVDSGVTSIVF